MMMRALMAHGALLSVAFEAASIKPAASPNSGGTNANITPGSLTLENYTL
jgi:hypothetical protein